MPVEDVIGTAEALGPNSIKLDWEIFIPFSPDLLTNIAIWRKAKLESYADLDPVGQFSDQIGTVHLTEVGAARPIFHANAGDPYIEFNGIDQRLFAQGTLPPASTDYYRLIVVDYLAQLDTFETFWWSYIENFRSGSFFGDNVRCYRPWENGVDQAIPEQPTGDFAIFVKREGDVFTSRVNGSESVVSGVSTAALHQSEYIGAAADFTEQCNYRCKEIITGDGTISAPEFAQLAEYIMNEYGIVL